MIPTCFIVGAPRCGTTALYHYLKAHPKIFMSDPKEPHYFGHDLDFRIRPYADLDTYLRLFESARDVEHAGEASVLYLYSRSGPGEILAVNPDARVIIMLRDPVEIIHSLHGHNLWLNYEDIEQALVAEDDRRAGRRIPVSCPVPLALHYNYLGRYTEHVERYLQAFGPGRVLVILYDDFRADAARVYRQAIDFLGLTPVPLPEVHRHNQRMRWRSQSVARCVLPVVERGVRYADNLPSRFLRQAGRTLLGAAFYVPLRFNATRGPRPRMPGHLQLELREELRDDIERLATLLGRDLSAWTRTVALR